MTKLAWYFDGTDRRERPWIAESILCALGGANGPILRRVAYDGVEEEIGAYGLLIPRKHSVLWQADCTDIFQAFARYCALSVIDRWDAPDIVRRYLETGDDTLREDAFVEARLVRAELDRYPRSYEEARAESAAHAAVRASMDEIEFVGKFRIARPLPRWEIAARAQGYAANAAAIAYPGVGNPALEAEHGAWLEAAARAVAGNPDDQALLAALREPA